MRGPPSSETSSTTLSPGMTVRARVSRTTLGVPSFASHLFRNRRHSTAARHRGVLNVRDSTRRRLGFAPNARRARLGSCAAASPDFLRGSTDRQSQKARAPSSARRDAPIRSGAPRAAPHLLRSKRRRPPRDGQSRSTRDRTAFRSSLRRGAGGRGSSAAARSPPGQSTPRATAGRPRAKSSAGSRSLGRQTSRKFGGSSGRRSR